jgi:hypothetical protein
MATSYHYFPGVAKWVKAKSPDQKYGAYTMSLYIDKPTLKEMNKAGFNPKIKMDDDGMFVTLRRHHEKMIKGEPVVFGPPKIFVVKGEEAEPFEGYVGNGSKVVAKMEIYDAGETKGSRWSALRVDELVEYVPEEREQPDALGVPF